MHHSHVPICPQHSSFSSDCPCLTLSWALTWLGITRQSADNHQPSPATPTPSPPLPLQLQETISWAHAEDPGTSPPSQAVRSLYWFHVSWNLRNSGISILLSPAGMYPRFLKAALPRVNLHPSQVTLVTLGPQRRLVAQRSRVSRICAFCLKQECKHPTP